MRLVHLDDVEHGCCGPAARADAAEVARIAGFPFEIVDLSATFDRTVIADFVAEHAAGRTPNPCARCNGEIKFGAFLRAGRRPRRSTSSRPVTTCGPSRDADGSWRLLRGRDDGQGPVLHAAHAGTAGAAPLAVPGRRHAEGGDARARAALRAAGGRQARLAGALLRAQPARRARSSGRARPSSCARATVVDPDGRVLARHDGTFGVHDRPAPRARRRDGGAALRGGPRRGGEPRRGRPARAALAPRPGRRPRPWVAGRPPAERSVRGRGPDPVPRRGHARRRRRRRRPASASAFARPQHAVAPGQSVVVYRGDELLGGGRIVGPCEATSAGRGRWARLSSRSPRPRRSA